ncbi:TetR family transcriptional regulator [Frondihabitans sp. PAMC 28766]|uniref:TetR/AcrR family transcriptional regulator n=1 Tax=Frondihabitans sp. PAMC 28766 TaxID=1795630 RepID=UPI00078DF574|nr:TetR/AcrR family transcriptional regulator [Frondihabitans sp. PAMC 28766]AMM21372.1 TetR family transcriptional regulator [Frondihabitans sp. PAMC 28766]
MSDLQTEVDRRGIVSDSALETFARFGYRKTSMDEVARAARISRPGLYFLFDSKEALFRAAVARALERDLAAVEAALADPDKSLQDRLLNAFDHWAGRYVGPGGRDIQAVIDDNPSLLGPVTETAPQRFEQLVTEALRAEVAAPADVAQTLISTSIGLKYQVDARPEYLARLTVALTVILP